MRTLLKLILRKLSVIISLMRVFAIVCLCFCTWMCIHYLIQHYPNANITSQPFDYNGMLISFFALLVTLLVGWNIYSTINAKDELEKTTTKLKEQYGKDIAVMKADIDKLKSSDIKRDIEQAEQKGIEQANEVDKDFVKLNFPQEIMDAVENQMKIEGTMLYVWAFNVADEYKTFRQIFDEFKSVQRKHPKRVAYIGGNQASDSKAKEIIKIARDSKLKMLASIRAMRNQTDKNNGDD